MSIELRLGILGVVMAGAIAMVVPAPAEAGKGPNRITTRAACKRWTSGGAQNACIACVKKGKDYFRDSGTCR